MPSADTEFEQCYAFDFKEMVFTVLPNDGNTPKLSLFYDGVDIDLELRNLELMNEIFIEMNLDFYAECERIEMENMIHNLTIRKNNLLKNLIIFLNDFWKDLDGLKLSSMCPNCGQPYLIKTRLEHYDAYLHTSPAG